VITVTGGGGCFDYASYADDGAFAIWKVIFRIIKRPDSRRRNIGKTIEIDLKEL